MSIPRAWQRTERRLKRPIRRAGEERSAWLARRRISHRGKTLRALRAYLDLIETTTYMQKELKTHFLGIKNAAIDHAQFLRHRINRNGAQAGLPVLLKRGVN